MSVSYGGDSIVFADGSVQSGGWTGMRNRIINGAMVIDQRNAGSAVTVHATFPVDRFRMLTTAGGTISGQQVADAPTGTGFKYSTRITVTSAATPSGGVTGINQNIEGYNVADFKMGSNDATTFTVSFWVKSSVAGTYGVSVMNGAATRFYLTTYTINQANTWEYKTIVVPGDTSGTWYTDNQGGIRVDFDLGSQSSSRGSTTNAWHTSGTYYQGPSGTTNLLSTLNATWQFTGLQVERGSTASSFEYRSYGAELALCQRYYETTSYPNAGQDITSTQVSVLWSTSFATGQKYLVAKRAAPTITIYGRGGTAGSPTRTDNGAAITGTSTASNIGATGFWGVGLGQSLTAYSTFAVEIGYTASAEL